MSAVKKQAKKDAYEYASAHMSYGEGAGTRRKLIDSAVMYKSAHVPGYSEHFQAAVDGQDMVKHVKSARRSRKTKDISAATSKNVKAAVRGDATSMSTPVIVALFVGGAIHGLGYDRKMLDYAKKRIDRGRTWIRERI